MAEMAEMPLPVMPAAASGSGRVWRGGGLIVAVYKNKSATITFSVAGGSAGAPGTPGTHSGTGGDGNPAGAATAGDTGFEFEFK